ncbi:MAG: aminotransferase class V-fold PLP-dependent enzyme [Ardenticatenia bacterium]|nr:aminotransferase class V-fold PLP-dependent enzyme [Ardenticatenia bacterium]
MTLAPGSPAVRALFPVTEQYAYLNHAAVAPLNRRTADAMRRWVADWEAHGTRAYPPAETVQAYRQRAAALFNAQPDEIAFTRNTTEGLLLVARGLDWRPGDNIVTVETEFTANVYPWKNVEAEGVTIRRVPSRRGRIVVEDVVAAMDHRTRVLAVSFVEFYTGYRNDLVRLGAACRQRGVCFCVDAIQGAGVLPIDVEAMHIDFLATGGPKWLLGPMGAGLFYCRRDNLNALDPRLYGWLSTADPDDYFDYEQPLSPTASRFEWGTLSWPSLVGLMESIALLLEVGVERIADYVLDLTGELMAALQAKGYELITPAGRREERSGIVTFRPSSASPEEVASRLEAAGVVVSPRGKGIRVAPHFYNTWEDIDRLLEALP